MNGVRLTANQSGGPGRAGVANVRGARRVLTVGVAGATATLAGLAVATPAQAVSLWPVPTVYCQYRVTSTIGVNERWGPGLSYQIERRLAYNAIISAGRDGTVYNGADGYTWRRVNDAYGQNGDGVSSRRCTSSRPAAPAWRPSDPTRLRMAAVG